MNNTYFERLHVSASPHIKDTRTTRSLMLDVCIALVPALVAAVWLFGAYALVTTVVSVAACVLFELLWQKLTKKPVTIGDFSAVVTGLLLAFNLPPSFPVVMTIIGAAFAIIVVKQLFGGLGHNFMNPALAARAVLMASWPARMTTFVAPDAMVKGFGALTSNVDALASATPLSLVKGGAAASSIDLTQLLLGLRGGALGETCALALIAGGIYLLARKVIKFRVTTGVLVSMAVLAYVGSGFDLAAVPVHLLGGGTLLGAFFMATDYATTPVSKLGQWIVGVGVGVICMVIRLWGGYAEGMSYAILLMNVAGPLVERFTRPRPFGEVKTRA